MDFRILHSTNSSELSYLLADRGCGEAVLIDPHSRDLPVIRALLQEHQLRLRWVLRTHQHDHLRPMEFERLRQLGAPLVQGEPREGATLVNDGQNLDFGSEKIKIWRTPDHTPYCLSYICRDRVFCGGLMAVDACDLQPYPAYPEALWDSVVQRLFTLPDETLLFAGHEIPLHAVSTVWGQRQSHTWFKKLDRDAFITHWTNFLILNN